LATLVQVVPVEELATELEETLTDEETDDDTDEETVEETDEDVEPDSYEVQVMSSIEACPADVEDWTISILTLPAVLTVYGPTVVTVVLDVVTVAIDVPLILTAILTAVV